MRPWRRLSLVREGKGVYRRREHCADHSLLVRMRKQVRDVVCLGGCGTALLRRRVHHDETLHEGKKCERVGFNTGLTACNVEHDLLPPPRPLMSIWSMMSACWEGLSLSVPLGTALWLFVRALAARAARISCEEESSD